MPRSNEYRNRATIQRRSEADGESAPTWGTSVITGYPCKITTISGQETYRGRQMEAGITHVVEGRRLSSAITSKDRLSITAGTHSGKTLNIKAVHNVIDRRGKEQLEMYCAEKP